VVSATNLQVITNNSLLARSRYFIVPCTREWPPTNALSKVKNTGNVNLAQYIEHTNLSPSLTIGQIDQLVDDANQYGFCGICVPPFWVKRASREIGNRPITLVTVAGFPLGYNMTETKLDEIRRAIDNGADEIDVVWNITSFKTGLPWTKIEIAKCSKLVHDQQKLLKVIIETAYLSDNEIEDACKLCADAGADFVKTSTGFASAGATVHHVQIMKRSLPDAVGIKASGGIKTAEQALTLINAGAVRIGTSSGIHIVTTSTPNLIH
jgi:deoxyribose-phosphate aldolase